MPRADSPYDATWQKLRARFLHHHPKCRTCSKPSKHVDHIITIRRAPERRLDWTNLQALCPECHNKLTNAFDNAAFEVRGGCDATGHTIDRRHPWSKMGDRVGKRVQGKQEWVRAVLEELRRPAWRNKGDV